MLQPQPCLLRPPACRCEKCGLASSCIPISGPFSSTRQSDKAPGRAISTGSWGLEPSMIRSGEVEGALAGETAALEDGVVYGGGVAVDVAAEHVPEAVAELLVAGDRTVRALPLPIGVAVEDESALEDRLAHRTEGVVDDAVAEGRRRNHAMFGVEDFDYGIAAGLVAARIGVPVQGAGLPSPGWRGRRRRRVWNACLWPRAMQPGHGASSSSPFAYRHCPASPCPQ